MLILLLVNKDTEFLFKREMFNQILFYLNCDLHLLFRVFSLGIVVANSSFSCQWQIQQSPLPS